MLESLQPARTQIFHGVSPHNMVAAALARNSFRHGALQMTTWHYFKSSHVSQVLEGKTKWMLILYVSPFEATQLAWKKAREQGCPACSTSGHIQADYEIPKAAPTFWMQIAIAQRVARSSGSKLTA
eukprot:1161941-Pelagomonas_calceolata.AAC.8